MPELEINLRQANEILSAPKEKRNAMLFPWVLKNLGDIQSEAGEDIQDLKKLAEEFLHDPEIRDILSRPEYFDTFEIFVSALEDKDLLIKDTDLLDQLSRTVDYTNRNSDGNEAICGSLKSTLGCRFNKALRETDTETLAAFNKSSAFRDLYLTAMFDNNLESGLNDIARTISVKRREEKDGFNKGSWQDIKALLTELFSEHEVRFRIAGNGRLTNSIKDNADILDVYHKTGIVIQSGAPEIADKVHALEEQAGLLEAGR